MIERTLPLLLAGVLAGFGFGCAANEEQQPSAGETAEGAPAAPQRNARRDAYFGDLHVHTSYSIDSYIFGNRLDPRDAYRFARGEAVTLFGGNDDGVTASDAALERAYAQGASPWVGT
jgi:hypothetical protein